MGRNSPPAPARAFRESLFECEHGKRQVTGLGDARGDSTKGSVGITQDHKGTLARGRGDAKQPGKV